MARQIAICPGTRKLRVCNRRLGTCSPSGGPTCGLCFGRALTGDPFDQCGGLFAPHQSLGTRFRVNRRGGGGGYLLSESLITSETIQAGSSGFYSDSFIVASAEVNSQCVPVIEYWEGGGTGRLDWLQTGPIFPYNGTGIATGQAWYAFNLNGPPTLPYVDTVAGSPWFLDWTQNHEPIGTVGTCAQQSGHCGYAYPRPIAVSAFVIAPISNLIFKAIQNMPGTPPSSVFGLTMYGRVFGPYHLGWQGEPCAGSTNGPGTSTQGGTYNISLTETWNNQVAGLFTRLHWSIEGFADNGAGSTSHSRYEWDCQFEVIPLDPCPGDAPDRNAAAIAGFMARGERAGCCG